MSTNERTTYKVTTGWSYGKYFMDQRSTQNTPRSEDSIHVIIIDRTNCFLLTLQSWPIRVP